MHISFISPLTLALAPEAAEEVSYDDPPLGILTLASITRRCGYGVSVYDLDHLAKTACSRQLVQVTADLVCSTPADVFGLGTISGSYPLTIRLAKEIRRRRPDAPILLGGPQASATDTSTLKAVPEIDIVVRGEAEEILPPLLKALGAGREPIFVPGLTYRANGRICRTGDAPVILDLDTVPDPAWDLDPAARERRWGSVELGRGCPFACEFCSTNDFFRRKFRLKSPERVLAQMDELHATYGLSKFSLVHDMFTVDRKRVSEFCEFMIRSGRNYQWTCSARTDCVDRELLELMKSAGCTGIFYGVESASPRLQKSMGKNLDVAQARVVVQNTVDLGLSSTVSLIIGFPDETKEDLRATCDMYMYAARLESVDKNLHLLRALPGTPLTVRHRDALVLDLTPEWWSGHDDDLELIRRFPDPFVSFYSMPTAQPREYLRELRWFLACGLKRCHWLMQAMHRDYGSIVAAFDHFYTPSMPRSPEWYRSLGFADELVQFAATRQPSSNFKATRVLADYYRQIFNASEPNAETPGPGEYSFSDDWKPSLPPNALAIRARGNVPALIGAMRTGTELDPAWTSERCWVLVRTANDGRQKVIRVTDLYGIVLHLCNGKRTALQIGRRVISEGFASAQLEPAQVADALLRRFHAEGLIGIGADGVEPPSRSPVAAC